MSLYSYINIYIQCSGSQVGQLFLPSWEEGEFGNIWKHFGAIKMKNATGIYWVEPNSVQSLSHVRLLATPWTAVRQASLSITDSWSSLKLTSIESVMPSSHLIFCRPLLLLSPIPPSIRVFSNESVLLIRWLKYWSFRFNISPSNEYSGPDFL